MRAERAEDLLLDVMLKVATRREDRSPSRQFRLMRQTTECTDRRGMTRKLQFVTRRRGGRGAGDIITIL